MKAILFLSFFLLISSTLFADEPASALNDASQKLSLLESKISRLQETQKQIFQKNEEIDKELDTLRIWIRRNRS